MSELIGGIWHIQSELVINLHLYYHFYLKCFSPAIHRHRCQRASMQSAAMRAIWDAVTSPPPEPQVLHDENFGFNCGHERLQET